MKTDDKKNIHALCDLFLLLETRDEIYTFLKDLCTPKEINTFAERWRVCKLLKERNLSYREIHSITGASLTTIGRVARCLNDENHQGYELIFNKLNQMEN